MTSEGLHEPAETLDADTIDRHRAIVSLKEELEAVDWYDQRVKATGDRSLAALLAHNRDEEKEHAAMTLEWLRRRDPVLDQQLRTYLFTDGDILGVEEGAGDGGDDAGGRDADAGAAGTAVKAGLDGTAPPPTARPTAAGDLHIRSLRTH